MSSRFLKAVRLTVSTHVGLGQVRAASFGIRHPLKRPHSLFDNHHVLPQPGQRMGQRKGLLATRRLFIVERRPQGRHPWSGWRLLYRGETKEIQQRGPSLCETSFTTPFKLIFVQGYDGQKAYDDYGGGYSKRNDQGHGGGEGYKKRLVPSEASPHVIFLGLDPDFTESDVSLALSPRPRILRIVFLCSFKPTSSATTAASSRSR